MLEEVLREDDDDIEVEEEKPKRSYRHYLRTLFPENKRYLPIVAEDFCYTMDIMFMRPDVVEDIEWGIEKRKTTASKFDSPWSCALVIVETTSRMAWAYPMKSKSSKEVLYCFKKFLSDIDFKISRLISDYGNEYSGIVKFNKEHIELPDEPNGLFKYYQVNASQNHLTALSRVDRFIRTFVN